MMTVVLLILYTAFVLWYGLRGSHHTENGRAFLTAGGAAPVLFCLLSLVSTIIGGSATIGMGGLAQKTGAAAFWWLGVGAIGLLLHGWLVAPKIRQLPVATLPEVAGYVSGRWAERWSGAVIAVSWIGVTAAQFVALHALLASVVPADAVEPVYLLIAAAVLLHTALGGQSGVIRTDVLQSLFLLVGFSAAAFWVFAERPAAVSALDLSLFNEKFGPADWARLMLLVGITYIVGPDMFSRAFAARSARAARWAAWGAAPCILWFGAVIVLLALVNIDAKSPITAWLAETSGMPAVLRALLTVGLVSALCGTSDTVLLSASGIIERNIFGRDRTGAVRLLVTVFGAAAAAVVYISGDIISLLLKAYAFYVPGVAVPLFIALLGNIRRLDARLWLTGSLAGGALGLASALLSNPVLSYAGIGIAAAFAVAAKLKRA